MLGLCRATFEAPSASFCALSADRNFRKGAYRLCSHPEVSLERLLSPAINELGAAIRRGEAGETVLCIQDTTELNLTHLPQMRGLGELTVSDGRGLFLHPALALTSTGVPVGLLRAKTFVRDPAEHGKTQQRRARLFEEKESSRWWETVEETERIVDCPGRLLTICDREADSLDFISRAALCQRRVLVRATQDRLLEEHGETETRRLWSRVLSHRIQGARSIYVPAQSARPRRQARAARWAEVRLRFAQVVLRKQSSPNSRVPVWAVWVGEEEQSDGHEPIEWMLLTTDPVESAAAAWQRVDWYLLRWRIEEFFNALKTGCQVESRQFETRERYEVALTFALLAAVKIVALRDLAREQPELPAKAAFNEVELAIITQQAARAGEPMSETPTIREAVRWIARIGGFQARASDGEPGWLTLWRGFTKLCDQVEGYLLACGAAAHRPFSSLTPLAWSLPPRPSDSG